MWNLGGSQTPCVIRFSVTMDGVTKSIDITVLDRKTEFKKWYRNHLDRIAKEETEKDPSAALVEIASRSIERMNALFPECYIPEQHNTGVERHAYAYLPDWVSYTELPKTGIPYVNCDCSVGQTYSHWAGDVFKEKFSSLTWDYEVRNGYGHTLGYYYVVGNKTGYSYVEIF